MNKFFTALLALAAIAVAMPAGAQEELECTTSEPEVDTKAFTGSDDPRYYVDNDPVPLGGYSIWVYQESNGVDGLQRGDEVKDDTDGGLCYESDTIIF